MNKNQKPEAPLYCSFCGKSQNEVLVLIAGPTVFICSDCVELCMDIVNDYKRQYQDTIYDSVVGDDSV